ncbi:MAG: hypothetical protein WD025_07520 [Bacteriovoracaceae bacterium]
MGDSQWKQIDKSVSTALSKHPSLKKYYICLPRDWSDSRKEVGDKTTNSAWDKWKNHVAKWEELAREKGMDVEFTYWCKHEMVTYLTSEDPKFSGRALYWFNEPAVSHSTLYKIANISKDTLGDRFSKEFHLDLPIAKVFDGIGQTKRWKELLKEKKDLLYESKSRYLEKFIRNENIDTSLSRWQSLGTALNETYSSFSSSILKNSFLDALESLQEQTKDILKLIDKCYEILHQQNKEGNLKDEDHTSLSGNLYNVSRGVSSVEAFLRGNIVNSAKNKVILLLGEAGIGKSHLLCDLTLKRLEESLPTLFVLGNHYEGGNAVDFFGKSLDLSNYSREQVLGALDACGEAHRTRLLIVVDAINEGLFKDQWFDQISPMVSELSSFENIALIFSCRSTFEDYLIPENLGTGKISKIQHHGFSGYEHRAASIYLSKQGISTPSAPVISPEFSNPLFLKTCCEAIKSSGRDSFPKGLNGITALFEFYINSVSKVVNRKKRFLPGENVVKDSLDSFVRALYPDDLHGIPLKKARTIIDNHDSKKNTGDTLFELLLDEGILSTDIAPDPEGGRRGMEVIRFTYERFSDHYLALHLVELYSEDGKIDKLFSYGEFINSLIDNHKLYSYSGVVEALGVIVPEIFKKEFVDYLDNDEQYYRYFFEHTFLDAVKWRSHNSFTSRTLELLNNVNSNSYHDQRIEILLSFSTEPGHLWNADLLDKNLKPKALAERDNFWSVPIALEDQSEEDGEGESTLRTIIDWALFSDLSVVEEDRLRLTAKVLTWMTTTSNRRIRDHATKSLAKVFLTKPNLILKTLQNFKEVDDLYLQERAYAASYGALCYIEDEKTICEVAEYVYKKLFKSGRPYPNLLLRDYGRGIMEYALSKGLLTDGYDIKLCRPPYSSEWPIENPPQEELDKMFEDTFKSAIKSSIMGFPGDFGNYSMGCVHRWSPTTLDKKTPQTGSEVHWEFSAKLPEPLKNEFKQYLEQEEKRERPSNATILKALKALSNKDLGDLQEKLKDHDKKNSDQKDDLISWDDLKKRLDDGLDLDLREELRWVSGLGVGDRTASISRKWMQRWVCKRAYDLGWSKDLFQKFEDRYCQRGRASDKTIERIGKKYQWIALRELLARLSDNLHWIDRGYSDIEDSKFYGPWQLHERDIDPSLLVRKTQYDGWSEPLDEFWWRPFVFKFPESKLEEQKKWLWNKEILPPFNEILSVESDEAMEFLVLHGFSSWRMKSLDSEKYEDIEVAEPDAWFRINSIVIKKPDVKKIKEKLIQKENLVDPHTVRPSSTGHQSYFKEYPWHPSCKDMTDWVEIEEHWYNQFDTRYLVPVCNYEWERGNLDKSIDESINFYLPSETLINELGLKSSIEDIGCWKGEKGQVIFLDPSVKNSGPSYALIAKQEFQTWLSENELEVIWLIGGEKQLFGKGADRFFGRLTYNALITYSNGKFETEIWFEEQKPRD